MTLERRTPLGRGKPLAPGKPLTRKAGVSRVAKQPIPRNPRVPSPTEPASNRKVPARRPARRPEPRAPRPRRRSRHTGPTGAVRDLVLARDRGRCVNCGRPASNIHHRRNRGSGGRSGAAAAAINSPANLLSLCGSGTTGCHGFITNHPSETADLGFVISTNAAAIDPAAVPVTCWDGVWLHDDHGNRTPAPRPEH